METTTGATAPQPYETLYVGQSGLAVLKAIASLGDAAQATVGTLAEIVGCSERTVMRASQRLSRVGWLRVERQTRRRGGGYRRWPNTYHILAECPIVTRGVTEGSPPRTEHSRDPQSMHGKGGSKRTPAVTMGGSTREVDMAREFKPDPKPVRPESEELVRGVDGKVKRRRVESRAQAPADAVHKHGERMQRERYLTPQEKAIQQTQAIKDAVHAQLVEIYGEFDA